MDLILKKKSSSGIFWVLNPYFSYDHQFVRGSIRTSYELNSGQMHTIYSVSLYFGVIDARMSASYKDLCTSIRMV